MSTLYGGAGGAIVNLSSVAATLGSAGLYVDYAASKGAIDTFTIGLAREVACTSSATACGLHSGPTAMSCRPCVSRHTCV